MPLIRISLIVIFKKSIFLLWFKLQLFESMWHFKLTRTEFTKIYDFQVRRITMKMTPDEDKIYRSQKPIIVYEYFPLHFSSFGNS